MKLHEARAIAHSLVAEWLETPVDSVHVREGHLTAHQTLLSDTIADALVEATRGLGETDNPAKLKRRLRGVTYAVSVLAAGLAGKPRRLGQTDGEWVEKYLAQIGVELVSRTQVERRGRRLKRRAKPLVVRYFGAPIKRNTELFDFGSQTVPK